MKVKEEKVKHYTIAEATIDSYSVSGTSDGEKKLGPSAEASSGFSGFQGSEISAEVSWETEVAPGRRSRASHLTVEGIFRLRQVGFHLIA